MNQFLSLGFALFCCSLLAGTAPGQELSFDNGALTFGAGDFTTVNGVSVLSLTTDSNYYANLGTELNLSPTLATSLGLNGPGWLFQESTGEVAIAANNALSDLAGADPFAAYGYANINNTSTPQNVSAGMTSNFAPTSFPNGAVATASFAFTLTSLTGASVSASVTQTGTLSDSGASPYAAGSPISTGSRSTSGSTAGFFDPSSEIIAPPGIYNQLAASASGTYSPGAIITLSGRIDVEEAPEPPIGALLAISGAAGILFHLRRLLRAS